MATANWQPSCCQNRSRGGQHGFEKEALWVLDNSNLDWDLCLHQIPVWLCLRQGKHWELAFLKTLQVSNSTASVEGRQGHTEETLPKEHKEDKGTRPVLGGKTERSGVFGLEKRLLGWDPIYVYKYLKGGYKLFSGTQWQDKMHGHKLKDKRCLWTSGNTFLLWGCLKTDRGWPGKLWCVPQCRVAWTQSWAGSGCRWPGLSRGWDQMSLKGPFPTQ